MDTEQKIQDKDLPNVRHLAMQEALPGATSFGISMKGDNNRKSVLVVALKAARPKLPGLAKGQLRKTGAVSVTRSSVQPVHGTSLHQKMSPKRPDMKDVNLSK
jgi:hypothetical protein